MNFMADARQDRVRNLHFLSCPELWVVWPYLPLIRRRPGQEEEYGILCDLYGASGLTGFRATVFFSNLFLLPPTVEELLALPKEVFDALEDVYGAGWRID
jgi:hypothetical protein